jgi:hypothetical protein
VGRSFLSAPADFGQADATQSYRDRRGPVHAVPPTSTKDVDATEDALAKVLEEMETSIRFFSCK